MARTTGQKLKILYIKDFLEQQTDEAHPATLVRIIEMLRQKGITAERKSIAADLEALQAEYGMDIQHVPGPGGGYFLATRMFELPELKLMVDIVQSSHFITEKKSLSLIRKLQNLCSVHDARRMQRQVLVLGRVKNLNEQIFYGVDRINEAIQDKRQITFKYYDYTLQKRPRFRHQGRLYRVSPYALTWDAENYYMVAYDSLSQEIRHYRVDRIAHLEVIEDAREGEDLFEKLDIQRYTHMSFSMFGGEERRICLEMDVSLVGLALDRFGKDIPLIPVDETRFRIEPSVILSPKFYAWVFALGNKARLIGPEDAVEAMKTMLQTQLAGYGE